MKRNIILKLRYRNEYKIFLNKIEFLRSFLLLFFAGNNHKISQISNLYRSSEAVHSAIKSDLFISNPKSERPWCHSKPCGPESFV